MTAARAALADRPDDHDRCGERQHDGQLTAVARRTPAVVAAPVGVAATHAGTRGPSPARASRPMPGTKRPVRAA
jgi:hypothetical protein